MERVGWCQKIGTYLEENIIIDIIRYQAVLLRTNSSRPIKEIVPRIIYKYSQICIKYVPIWSLCKIKILTGSM